MGAKDKEEKNPPSPLLNAYLRATPGLPPHIPEWVHPTGWATFIVLLVVLCGPLDLETPGFVAAAAAGFGLVTLLKHVFRADTPKEQVDEHLYGAVRKFKKVMGEGSLGKRLPRPVLLALEDAVEAYNGAVARLTVQDPLHALEKTHLLKQVLHSCFMAALPVLRDDNMGKADWKAIQDNHRLIGSISDSIRAQRDHLASIESFDTERLLALRELESEVTPGVVRVSE